MFVALMMGCTGTGDTQDVAQANHPVNASFDQTKSLADSLYSCMQFRDAYDLYLQLLDNKEAEADSEKKLDLLNALCNTSELAGHKAEQTKWLEQLIDRRMALAKIAVECGFNSSTYFSSRFRQHFGMSPTEFRKEALQQGEF
jgi:hypothetical protein